MSTMTNQDRPLSEAQARKLWDGLSPAMRRMLPRERRHNDCTSNTVATMRALENRGLGERRRHGYGSGRPDYTWRMTPTGRVVWTAGDA